MLHDVMGVRFGDVAVQHRRLLRTAGLGRERRVLLPARCTDRCGAVGPLRHVAQQACECPVRAGWLAVPGPPAAPDQACF